ncbi:peptidase M15 [Caudoviricetes sp.]|nr:peptidase M15 [Caudoviricetes sp.]UOF79106.1 peptidase M15 [Caudoviricetes sp.]
MIKIFNRQKKERLSDHFHSEEFECGCCHYAIINTKLVQALESFRAFNGGKKLVITSGYRCPQHNRHVGGGTYSRHLAGLAVDVQWEGCSEQLMDEEWRKALRERAEYIGIYGLGFGPVFLHIDIDADRKHLTTWSYKDGKAE